VRPRCNRQLLCIGLGTHVACVLTLLLLHAWASLHWLQLLPRPGVYHAACAVSPCCPTRQMLQFSWLCQCREEQLLLPHVSCCAACAA
jgi:hypothetical protein